MLTNKNKRKRLSEYAKNALSGYIRPVSIITVLLFISFLPYSQNVFIPDTAKQTSGDKSEVIHLDASKFKKEIFDYDNNKEWKYKGNKPAIIDFYADWCRPCKMIAPVLENLQKEYKGEIQIYKVNTQYERELASVFGISGIPALLFIPLDGEPTMSTGALPKTTLEKYIEQYLGVKKR